jgi:hypothetical protein
MRSFEMRARLTLFLIGLPVLIWAFFGFFGDRVASRLSSKFGPRILASGDSKFTNAQIFIHGRLNDGAILVSAACLIILAYRVLAAASRRLTTPTRWVVQGWGAFICLNIFAAVAAHTVLFWCLLFTGKDHTNNYTQYRIKQGLMKECDVASQAVLMGASQTRREIDTKVLNERVGRKLWTTELHFPGSSPYDMVLCLEGLPKVRVDYVITYLSENNFYSQSENGRLMYFFGCQDLLNYWTLGPGKPDIDSFLICGVMGDIFPLYRMWEPIMDRARGWQTQNADQQRYDASLESNLADRAQRAARTYSFGPESDFQKRSFETFAKMCRERGSQFVVCCGQLNPILQRDMDPALRRDMMAFLRQEAGKDPNIILLEDTQLPSQGEDDYDDLTHVNAATRVRFSQYLAGVLENLVQTNSPALTRN